MRQPVPGPPPTRCRARDLGIRIGHFPPGPTDSIADVTGVRVGHATVWRNEPPPPAGRGVARTGVTAIVPFDPGELFRSRVPAGAALLNGAGEAIGITQIGEWGVIETPVFLTSTMALGRVADAAVSALAELDPAIGEDDALLPVVAECDDGYLSTSPRTQIEPGDVRRALAAARGAEAGAPATGAVGSGTGMTCFGLKGGIGTASRRVVPVDRRAWAETGATAGTDAGEAAYTVGVLVMANFGLLEWLTVDGVPVGRELRAAGWSGVERRAEPGERRDAGSCIVVVATDAPLLSGQLDRLARRAGLGLGRTGSFAGHGSGEIFLAFSTGVRIPRGSSRSHLDLRIVDDEYLGPFFAATVEATEEAVIDALVGADTVTGRDGRVAPALPLAQTVAILRRHGHAGATVPVSPGGGPG